ncbi:bifunctional Delta(1)-pyrroline-2-carboxylate/Delta(1)-piperideine-2-carboxylate reductase [Caballeronia sp. DA-9]|uniref:bifunctional Delta(1)-pyrroline-2-carboxylate/Delta(1)-piperideine-2- carboxylate reductase n=1 Tax=Caballeronia sp. DA-9 TaxID=3436237 RepID=UPI003F67A1A7
MSGISVFDAEATAALLSFDALVNALRVASVQHDAGEIQSPLRTSVPLGSGGVLLSMPASASDIAIHKLVAICPDNARKNLPTILGTVTVCDGETGRPEFLLDGPTLTARRTAALSMVGATLYHPLGPRAVMIIGTGQQASTHAHAIGTLFPSAQIWVKGHQKRSETDFCKKMAAGGVRIEEAPDVFPEEVDTVITVTTSKVPVYREVATVGRLIIAVGAFTSDAAEVDAHTVQSSRIFVDDINATRAEAGDLLQAKIDWARVRTLGSAVLDGVPRDEPVILKTVGSGAWDLAACRVARAAVALEQMPNLRES